MVSPEVAMVINVVLNAIILIPAIIVSLLIPSNKKIRSGEAGTEMGATWIPVTMIFLIIVAVAMIPVTISILDGDDLPYGLGLDILAVLVVVMATYIYFSAKKTFKELLHPVEEVAVVHAETVEGHHVVHPHHPVHSPTPSHPHHNQGPHHDHSHGIEQPNTVTVECPQCGNHIQLAEGSHQITCPYCGLAGTL